MVAFFNTIIATQQNGPTGGLQSHEEDDIHRERVNEHKHFRLASPG
jgi:hypothetical protein